MAGSDKGDAAEIDFMSMVSHELSTPLGSIRWNAELLRSGRMTTPLDDGQAQLADEIIAGVKRMGDLVDDIHEASWLERDKFADEPTEVAIADIIRQAQADLQTVATTKHLNVVFQDDNSLPKIMARRSTVLLILQNLLSNAVKYTPENGSITVHARVAEDPEMACCPSSAGSGVCISVIDTGIGIPTAQHNRVFSKFFRGDNARALGADGTGLGTYIISLAVASLQGATWFESNEGQGTSFFVVIPLGS